MLRRSLRTVVRDQGCVAALKSGEATLADADLAFEEVDPLVTAFRHMVREQRYDISEMALTTYLCAREHGAPITAIPAFIARGLHHGAMYRRADGPPISDLRGLHGRSVGVSRGYTVTTGVWARAILADEHAVDLTRIRWVRSSDEHVATYVPPGNVETTDEDLLELVRSGVLDAVVGVEPPSDDMAPLIPDPEGSASRALHERRFYPINHVVVVRDALLDEHPRLASELLEAFEVSKQRQLEALRAGSTLLPTANDELHRTVVEAGWPDPLPFGVAPNLDMLECLVDHALAQGILRVRPRLSEVFTDGTD